MCTRPSRPRRLQEVAAVRARPHGERRAYGRLPRPDESPGAGEQPRRGASPTRPAAPSRCAVRGAWATILAQPLSGWDQSGGACRSRRPCRPNGRWRDSTTPHRATGQRRDDPSRRPRPQGLSPHALIASSPAEARSSSACGRQLPAALRQVRPADAPRSDTRRLLVHAYYVSADSSGCGGLSVAAPQATGVRTGPFRTGNHAWRGRPAGAVRGGRDGDGSTDRYVEADASRGHRGPRSAHLAARAGQRARPAWDDATHYAYANQDEPLPGAERALRRVS